MTSEDPQNIERNFKIALGFMRREAPEVLEAFLNVLRSIHKQGALSIKEKELISLGIALYARCEPCIVLHTKSALESGATMKELIETCEVAITMGGSPTLSYTSVFFKALEKFSQKPSSP